MQYNVHDIDFALMLAMWIISEADYSSSHHMINFYFLKLTLIYLDEKR